MSNSVIALYPHGGSGNHGCEAIVRATNSLLGKDLVLFSDNPKEDFLYSLDEVCVVQDSQQKIKKLSFHYLFAWLLYHITKDNEAFDKIVFRKFFRLSSKSGLAFSIGGDNYCYGGPDRLYFLDRELRKRRVKTILWGCSIEPDSIDTDMLKDLLGFSHIFARESITYSALKSAGLANISLIPDPAFCLSSIALPLPHDFIDGNTVGINVSPMVIRREKISGIVMNNFSRLIDFIITHTQMNVALIPHVVWAHNDDREPLSILFDKYKDSHRVVFIEDCKAEELKGFISRCRFMIASRTHASIAAYSSKVPTIVMGYSVKARGIARDIFKSEDGFVLPVQNLVSRIDLTESFINLMKHEDEIRAVFNLVIPKYLERLSEVKSIIRKL